MYTIILLLNEYERKVDKHLLYSNYCIHYNV